MILSQERWMELRAFKALAEAGASWAEIARETGHDWRTVKRYLSADAPAAPPAPARRGPGPRKIDRFAGLVDAWLRSQPRLKASVIGERLGRRAWLHRPRSAGQGVCPGEPGPAGRCRPRAGRFPPTIRGPAGGAGPGRLGRRGRDPNRDRAAARLQLPHGAVVLA